MLFDKTHITFMLLSFISITLLLYLCTKYVKSSRGKNSVLKIAAISTLIIHHIALWFDFFTFKQAVLEDNMLFMIYPCNVGMWFLFIYAISDYKETRLMKMIGEFTFYLGITGGLIGIMFNANYSNTPTLKDIHILKGLLSHATMLFGSLYLYFGGFIKIRVKNVLSGILGYIFMLLNANILIKVFNKAEISIDNPMFLMESPIPSKPWINIYTMGLAGLILLMLISATYEFLFLKKEDRWYYILLKRFRKTEEIKDERVN